MTKHYERGDVVFFGFAIYPDSCVIGGNRPWVVVQNNMGNIHSPTTIVVPMTSRKPKRFLPTHVLINWDVLKKPSIILCEQVRTVDIKDDWLYVGRLPPEWMEQVDVSLRNAFWYERRS